MQIVRNFLEKNEFAVLERVASTVYAAVDKCGAPPDLQDQVAAWGGIGVPRFQDTNVSASDVDDLLEIIQRKGAQFVGQCKVIPPLCLFRRHLVPRTHITWHVDADGAGTMPYDPCVNIWIPLVSVGQDRPSLELIPNTFFWHARRTATACVQCWQN